jgi:hypothetical protein
MKAESIASWEILITDPSLTTQINSNKIVPKNSSDKLRRDKPGIINLFQPDPPDEERIRELNALVAKYPFCVYYKAKKHDTL